MKTRDITTIAVMAALICVAGPISIPVGPIPVSLASFAVYMAGAVLGSKKGTAAVVLYLLIGIAGVPVFSGFTGGFQKLAGVTGGYLAGYIPCAWITGMAHADSLDIKAERPRLAAAACAGTVVLYLIGTAWFMIQTGRNITESLSMCVLPFLPGDALKIAATVVLASPVVRAVRRAA